MEEIQVCTMETCVVNRFDHLVHFVIWIKIYNYCKTPQNTSPLIKTTINRHKIIKNINIELIMKI